MNPYQQSAVFLWIRAHLPVTLCSVVLLFGIAPLITYTDLGGASAATSSSSSYKISAIETVPANQSFVKSVVKSAAAKSSTMGCGGEIVSPENAQFEQRVVELINGERDEAGLPPLKMVVGLTNAARYHVADLVENTYFEHDSYDRINDHLVRVCEWKKRVQAYYPTPLAEVLTHGPATPQTVVQAWMEQGTQQILGEYREIGVGYSHQHWVQTLGTRTELYPLVINGEAMRTDDTRVSLYIYGTWDEIRLRNNGGEWSDWLPFANTMDWTLEDSAGQQIVEAEMRTSTTSASSSDMIDVALMEN